MSFEGILMSLNFNVSQFFRHSHTLSLTQVAPPGYKFGVTLVGKKRFSEGDAFPFVMGDIDPSGNLNSQIIHQPFEWWRTKFVAQVLNPVFYCFFYCLSIHMTQTNIASTNVVFRCSKVRWQ